MTEEQPSYNELIKLNAELQKEIEVLKYRLKKYTNPERKKKYYENHREEILERQKIYNKKSNKNPKKLTKEQRQVYNRTAYQKRKLKKLEQESAINQ